MDRHGPTSSYGSVWFPFRGSLSTVFICSSGTLPTFIAAISFLISVAVSVISVKNGQTWAHQLLRVRVVSLQGEPLNGFHMFLRDLAHLPDFLFICLGFLWALWDRKKQTFADKICKTMVVAQ